MFNRDNGEVTSLTQAGVVFLVFLAIAIITFALISPLTTTLFDSFSDSDFSNAEDEKDTYLPTFRDCFTAFMAIFVSLPMTWFIFWVFHRQANYNEYNRRF